MLRAASGSRRDPNSSIATTATTAQCHALSSPTALPPRSGRSSVKSVANREGAGAGAGRTIRRLSAIARLEPDVRSLWPVDSTAGG